MTQTLRDKLRGEVMASYWEDLAPHAGRAALLMLRENLDLLDAAEVLARDDVKQLEVLLRSGGLVRVNTAAANALENEVDARFQFIVVQPWVLAQRLVGEQ